MSDWEAEQWVLTTAEGQTLLSAVSEVRAPGPSDLVRWRKGASAEHVAAAVRLVEARRRARAKFSRADAMWLERTGLEQSTAELVARHKARRFEGAVADLCCGIGGDTLAFGERCHVVAVDIDPGMCRRTLWNARAYGAADHVAVVTMRAEQFSVPHGMLVHTDPDRRARAATRARSVSQYAPGLDFLHSLIKTTHGGAIKLSPASDFDAHFPRDSVEIELISLDGECKEATVWFGSLATCRRRATVLPDGATWADRDAATSATAPLRPVSSWIYDPDPALVRSGLLDTFALAHGLGRCAAGIDYLTGPELLDSPFLSPFAVAEILPFDLKRLRRVVKERALGPLEIKVRGLDARPEALRAQLRPPGPNPATLLLMGGTGPARVILARRVASRVTD